MRPPYEINPKILQFIARITEKIGAINAFFFRKIITMTAKAESDKKHSLLFTD